MQDRDHFDLRLLVAPSNSMKTNLSAFAVPGEDVSERAY